MTIKPTLQKYIFRLFTHTAKLIIFLCNRWNPITVVISISVRLHPLITSFVYYKMLIIIIIIIFNIYIAQINML